MKLISLFLSSMQSFPEKEEKKKNNNSEIQSINFPPCAFRVITNYIHEIGLFLNEAIDQI